VCGLLFSSRIPDDEDKYLGAAKTFVRHRGTEPPKCVTTDGMLFAHSLLPVQGHAPVEQPVARDGNVLVFSGEIWTHTGYSSDTEYLFDLLAGSPDICRSLRDLDGMFALVFWSGSRGCVYFASDVFGEIPLYFARAGDDLLVATEIKQLTAAGASLREIVPAEPGTLYTYSVGREELARAEYHSWSFSNEDIGLDEKKVVHLLRESVRKKYETIDLQRSALLFSGGLDSAILAYELARLGLKETYTVVAHKGAHDFRAAQLACRKLGVEFNPVIARELVPDCAIAVTEVTNRSIIEEMCCHLVLANELGQRGIRVALSGCGADEIFLGYQHLLRYRNRHTRRTLQREFVRGYHRMDLRAFNKAYMLNAIEVRNPYLCRDLLGYAATLDVDSLLIGRRREMKVALRRAYRSVLGELVGQPKRIARETMGARQALSEEYGDSPFVYRRRWKEILGDPAETLRLTQRARMLH
jgi:asparagine synthase (glutamine-hydrolysing)